MATLNLNEKKIPSAENLRLIAQLCISLANKQSSLEDRCIAPWKSGEVYQKDISYVSYNDYLYFCTVSNSDIDFVESHWTKLSDTISELTKADIEALVNLTPEEISKLSDIISTEIRLDKTFSSSDTYMRIQAAIDTAKEYTNNQLGKAVKPAYKVVASTSEVTETGYFYLISNGTNYDMYVLSADGSAVSLGTSDVDLSDYYTKTEVDNDFLKKTDATSTYATITTVDGKVDKTSILTALDDAATDDQVYSAKALNTELVNGVVKKTDIATTIDGTSTDDTVPTNKAVYDNCVRVKNLEYSYTDTLTTLEEVILSILNNTNPQQFKPGVYSGMIASTHSGGGDLGSWKGNYILTVSHNGAYGTSGVINTQSKSYHIQYSLNKWIIKRICTTSVADVAKTYLNLNTMSNITFGNISGFYLVSNGFCTVDISFNCTTSAPIEWETAYDSLPKPKSVFHMSAPASWSDAAPLLINVNTNGTMDWYIGSTITANSTYYVNFTYPVAES